MTLPPFHILFLLFYDFQQHPERIFIRLRKFERRLRKASGPDWHVIHTVKSAVTFHPVDHARQNHVANEGLRPGRDLNRDDRYIHQTLNSLFRQMTAEVGTNAQDSIDFAPAYGVDTCVFAWLIPGISP